MDWQNSRCCSDRKETVDSTESTTVPSAEFEDARSIRCSGPGGGFRLGRASIQESREHNQRLTPHTRLRKTSVPSVSGYTMLTPRVRQRASHNNVYRRAES